MRTLYFSNSFEKYERSSSQFKYYNYSTKGDTTRENSYIKVL